LISAGVPPDDFREQKTLSLLHSALPAHIHLYFVVFFVANLAHFVHNAEYIAYYPGMPSWLSPERVYRTKLKVLGLMLVATYGALGIDGLAHYTLALCSEHTLATNLTIWFEVLAGLSLLLASAAWSGRHISMRGTLKG
jgi:hypothetical protein